jgi:hypothetical protein
MAAESNLPPSAFATDHLAATPLQWETPRVLVAEAYINTNGTAAVSHDGSASQQHS